jgi:hypothetical protein
MAKNAQKPTGGEAAPTGASTTNSANPQVNSVAKPAPAPSAKSTSKTKTVAKTATKPAAKNKKASKPAAKSKPSPKPVKPIPQVNENPGLYGPGLYGPGPFWSGNPYGSGSSGSAGNGTQENSQAHPRATAQNKSQANMPGGGMRMGDSENYLDFLARVFQNMGTNPWNAQQFDNVTQGMTLVLGSGPAFAALESMMANTTAQSAVLMNAVQTQRQLDQVGLCCTSACVQQLLNMNNNRDQD